MQDTKIENVETVNVDVTGIVSALREHGKASAQVAIELTAVWPTDEDGKRSKSFYVDNIQPRITAAGFTMTYDTARVYASVVDTYGDTLLDTVDRFGWTQANEAARGGNTGNAKGALNVLDASTRDENGKQKVDDDGNVIRPTVDMVKATARDLAIPDGKAKAKATRPKPLTVPNLTQAEIRKHDTDAIEAYRAKLAEQIKRADNVLRSRAPKTAAA